MLVSLLADTAPSGGGDNNSLKIAIISTLGIVVAAAITAIFATFRRDTSIVTAPTPQTTTDYITELVRRATEAETQLHAKDTIIQQRDNEIDRLNRILLIARIDPTNGRPLSGSGPGGST